MEFTRTIRGVDVTIFAEDFSSDPSVGVGDGFDQLWAETEDGSPFELTEKESEDFQLEAVEAHYSNWSDDDY